MSKSQLNSTELSVFNKLKDDLLNIDPIFFVEKYLTLDGKPFRINGSGYKPLADIYRYIGIKALEPNSKPLIICKSRQCGATTMCSALSLYFMCSGIFGVGNNPPIRVMHTFPQLELAAAYAKTKLAQIISTSKTIEDPKNTLGSKKKSYIQSFIDTTSQTNDSLHFKQFINGNHLWVESIGLDADRVMGRSADVIMIDECFPSWTKITTNIGKRTIGSLYNDFINKKSLPLVKSFNELTNKFEFKKITHAWQKNKQSLIELNISGEKIQCTKNHKFLTENGWKEANNIKLNTLIKFYNYDNHSFKSLTSIKNIDEKKIVYDIEIEDNHNFIIASNKHETNLNGPIVHNCQKTTDQAIGNATKILTTAKYGNKGVTVMFGTPRRKGSSFHTRWTQSTQQYYYLGCLSCKKHFPLYTPGSDDWEKIWLHGFIVKCTHCGHEQDKRQSAEKGKWVAMKDENDPDCKMVGFHINILYMPMFTKEDVLKEKPGVHPVNTERVYQNEVMGEFFQGDSSPITIDDIRMKCADFGRKMRQNISFGEEPIVICGIDYGAKNDIEQMANPDSKKSTGQSFSTAVILTCKGPGLLSIEFATKFKRNDFESKKGIIDQLMRQYSINLIVADIGFSNDFSQVMQSTYGDRYLVSRSQGKVNNYAKFNDDVFPKEIVFEKDYYIGELYDNLKRGMIKFPYGDYEKIAWLVEHCANMEIKPSISRTGDPTLHYVKAGVNDGFSGLLNAYIAYKYIISKGFTEKGVFDTKKIAGQEKPAIIGGYITRRF